MVVQLQTLVHQVQTKINNWLNCKKMRVYTIFLVIDFIYYLTLYLFCHFWNPYRLLLIGFLHISSVYIIRKYLDEGVLVPVKVSNLIVGENRDITFAENNSTVVISSSSTKPILEDIVLSKSGKRLKLLNHDLFSKVEPPSCLASCFK